MAEMAAPPAERKLYWGDEVEEEAAFKSASSVDATVSSVDALSIRETEFNGFLDEPEEVIVKAVTTGDTPYTSASTFEDLKLTPALLKGLYTELKFQHPSKIQAISLPMILTPPYKNLVAQAHNGSGKTTCFVLGMLSRVDPNLKAPQALCICPTRELAIQNLEVLRKMGKHTGITSECAVPMDSTNYMSSAKRPPVTAQIVIGTPGTIKKGISMKKLLLNSVKILVFDEADHMLAEDGFKDDSLRIMKDIQRISAHCQVLLFSATFNEIVKNFVSRVVNDHNQLFVKKEELSLESVKQYKVDCPDELSKVMVIKDRILELGENLGQTIIFVRTRHSASTLHKSLVELGYEVTTIQGALKQEDRDKIVKEFKDGLTQVLISTDLLARGFDQQQVNLVINYDLPVKHENHSEPDYEVYLHRIGRAGRFGRKGAVFNLLMGGRDEMLMEKIERHFNSQIAQVASWNSAEDFKGAFGTWDRTGQDGTTFSYPAFGASVTWDRTGQGGTKNPKNCPTQIARPGLSHAWDKYQNDSFTLNTSKNYKNTKYKINPKAFSPSLILVSLSLSSFFLSTNTHLSLSIVAATAADEVQKYPS